MAFFAATKMAKFALLVLSSAVLVVTGLPADSASTLAPEPQAILGTGGSTILPYASVGPAAAPTPYRLLPPHLDTPWTEKVGTNPWPQHPRPRLVRDDWVTLNGIWTYQSASSGDELNNPPQSLAQEVLIPSCIESGISGIMAENVMYMWFATNFKVPSDWDKDNHVVLIFEAVDYEATVFVNGHKVGFHRGGYFRFTIDVTEHIKFGESNEL